MYNCDALDLFELGSNPYPFYLINLRIPVNQSLCHINPNGPNCAIGKIADLRIIVGSACAFYKFTQFNLLIFLNYLTLLQSSAVYCSIGDPSEWWFYCNMVMDENFCFTFCYYCYSLVLETCLCFKQKAVSC